MSHVHESGWRPVSLITYLRHIVDEHDIEETGTMWRSERETFDRIHARCHLIELHGPRSNEVGLPPACPECLGGIYVNDPIPPRSCGCWGLLKPVCGTCFTHSEVTGRPYHESWPCQTWQLLQTALGLAGLSLDGEEGTNTRGTDGEGKDANAK